MEITMKMIRFLHLFILIFSIGCQASSSPTYKAIYLVKNDQGQLRQSDLDQYPEVYVAHSFQELKDHTNSKVAIWIDKDATDLLGSDFIQLGYNGWFYQPPQKYYPYVFVGVGSYLPTPPFEDGPPPPPGTSPEQDRPGFTVWLVSIEDSGGEKAIGKGYVQTPTVAGILEVTNAMLQGQLPATPLPPPTATPYP